MRLRPLIFYTHLVLGLLATVYAALIGITGSILVFEQDLIHALYPQFFQGPPGSASGGSALALMEQSNPGWTAYSLTFPNPDSPHWMAYMVRGRESQEVYVDSRTGQLLGARPLGKDWIGWVSGLHNNLHWGRTGRLINGYGALILLALALTGLWLWAPSWRLWRQRFQLSLSAPLPKTFYNLHHAAGLIAAPFVIAIAITGAYYTWIPFYVATVESFTTRTTEPKVNAKGTLLDVDSLIAKGIAAVPGAQPARLQIVHSTNQSIRFTFREGTPREFHLVSNVFLHPVTGDPLKVVRLSARPAGDSILGGISALHFGIFGGRPVQVVWSLLGLLLPTLAASGLYLSLRRARLI